MRYSHKALVEYLAEATSIVATQRGCLKELDSPLGRKLTAQLEVLDGVTATVHANKGLLKKEALKLLGKYLTPRSPEEETAVLLRMAINNGFTGQRYVPRSLEDVRRAIATLAEVQPGIAEDLTKLCDRCAERGVKLFHFPTMYALVERHTSMSQQA